MYIHVQAAAAMLPLLHPTLPAVATDLHPVPIAISGIVCSSAHDMAGLYEINAAQTVAPSRLSFFMIFLLVTCNTIVIP